MSLVTLGWTRLEEGHEERVGVLVHHAFREEGVFGDVHAAMVDLEGVAKYTAIGGAHTKNVRLVVVDSTDGLHVDGEGAAVWCDSHRRRSLKLALGRAFYEFSPSGGARDCIDAHHEGTIRGGLRVVG